jgi:amphi-Trp domain-containing protein
VAKETVLFKSEEKKSLPEVASFLRLLADKLETGQVILQQGEESLPLDIPGQVVLEIKAEEEPKKNSLKRSLEIEIEWNEGDVQPGPVSLG